jgi:hypothetical protein
MRDNHDRMPELLTAYERDGQFFAVAAVTLGSECRQFEFGLPHKDYTALRRILQSHPFDQLPGSRYRHFVADSVRRLGGDCVELTIRIEQGSSARQIPFEVPQSLGANLLWFARLQDFAATTHLNGSQAIPRKA